ncbi:MAG: chemotaxis protein [Rhodobacteraceae bacterium]|nr:MAG: chemotaxis protein [Paracoccaceae bacterium]
MNDNTKREIDAAVEAHGKWKHRLLTAAIKDERNLPVADIARDDCCQFGKWLHGIELSFENRNQVETIKTLHAEFHKEAAAVAGMISKGSKDQALQALKTGAFIDKSVQLRNALVSWKVTLR